MRILLLILFAAVGLSAQGLEFFVHTPGQTADGPALGSTYDFPDTDVGANSTVVLRLRNKSTTQVYIVRTVFTSDPNFSLDGSTQDECLAANGFEDLTVSFAPQATGAASSPVEIGYVAYPASTGCPSSPPQNVQVATLATLNGNGITATLDVSVALNGNTSPISAGTTIAFGEVPVASTKTATIKVLNSSSVTLPLATPAIVAAVFSQPPFTLGSLANWPTSLAAGSSASFTLTFTPTQQALVTASLTIGSRSYPLTGIGVPGEGLSSLLVTYTLPSGVHYTISPVSPVSFGSALTGSSSTFIFTISNPSTNFDPQTISTISLSGSGFSLTNLPTLPVTLQPGATTTFSVIFAPTQAGAASAALAIGTLKYTLTGTVSAPALNPSFQFTPQTPVSDQQAQLSINLPNAAQVASIGTLTMTFSSSVTGVTSDPAIVFVSTGGRNTNVNFALGATTGTFPDGTSSLSFQTGTTAGTLTFNLSFADGESYSKSIELVPETVQILSASATKQSPYVVINLSAFDNTYSASKVVFNFYNATGATLTSGGIPYDGTQSFHGYFFVNNQAGGAFTLQAQFPVTGDITTIAAADVTIQNSSGQSQTQHLTF
jgi:Abnormal spindle-like microcephaly-assoc'd, ASPM-SPD-2-Hydin